MLYAHYEGFCLYAFSVYLDSLEKMRIIRGECRYGILRYSLQQHLPAVRNKSEADFIQYLRSGGFVAELLNKAIEFPRDKKLKREFDLGGRSNLWPKELAACCDCCCIASMAIDPKDVRLRQLVGRRNDIAHGKDTPVRDHFEYEEYETYVFDVMDKIARAVDTAFDKCDYLEITVRHRHVEQFAHRVWCETGRGEKENWHEAERRVSEGERAY